MRGLVDVDANPEIDTTVFDVLPGDRWMLCSDGLSSYVSDDKIEHTLKAQTAVTDAADRLVKESLDQGAPDNVTVVIVDIDETGESASSPVIVVGSAASPLTFEGESGRRPLRLPTLLLHPLKSSQAHEDSHFEPESDEYLDELILEDRRRARRRRITWLVGVVVIVALIMAALFVGYRWSQSLYYVGADGRTVAIYRGVQQDLGPISLHSIYSETSVQLADLPSYTRKTVEDTISAADLAEAKAIIKRLTDASK